MLIMLNRLILLTYRASSSLKRTGIRFIAAVLHPDVCCACDQLSLNPLWFPLLCRKWVWASRPWNESQRPVLPRCLTPWADAASDQACCRRCICLSTRQCSISPCQGHHWSATARNTGLHWSWSLATKQHRPESSFTSAPQIRSTILALYKLVCMYVCMYGF